MARLTTPMEISEKSNVIVEEIIDKIETEFQNISKENLKEFYETGFITVIIGGEYTPALRDKIANKYMHDAGWQQITHTTSSENGERGGLTRFKFMK